MLEEDELDEMLEEDELEDDELEDDELGVMLDDELDEVLEEDELVVETVELLAVLEVTMDVEDMLELLELETGAYSAALFGSLQR